MKVILMFLLVTVATTNYHTYTDSDLRFSFDINARATHFRLPIDNTYLDNFVVMKSGGSFDFCYMMSATLINTDKYQTASELLTDNSFNQKLFIKLKTYKFLSSNLYHYKNFDAVCYGINTNNGNEGYLILIPKGSRIYLVIYETKPQNVNEFMGEFIHTVNSMVFYN